MFSLRFDSHEPPIKVWEKIKAAPESEITVEADSNPWIRQNSLNQKIITALAEQVQKKVIWQQPPAEAARPQAVLPAAPLSPLTPRSFFNRKALIFASLFLSVLGLSASSAVIYFYLPEALVTLEVEQKILEKEVKLAVDPKLNETDFANESMPGEWVAVLEETTEKFEATGKKTVGEKARGKISLQNWTDADVFFKAGTEIKVESGQSGAGLTLNLDKDAVVPKQTFSVPTPGQRLFQAGEATVEVAAAEIGSQYNLAAGTNFTIDDKPFAQFAVTALEKFSGGESHEVTVVSEQDQKKAKEELSVRLFAKAKGDLKTRLKSDQKLVEGSIKDQVLTSAYEGKIGEEHSDFNLTLKTETKGLIVSDSMLKAYLIGALRENIPIGFTLLPDEDLVGEIVSTQVKNEEVLLLVRAKGLVVPSYDLEKLKIRLLGQKIEAARAILEELPNLSTSKIELYTLLPSRFQVLPFRAERLSIKMVTR